MHEECLFILQNSSIITGRILSNLISYKDKNQQFLIALGERT